MRIQIFITLVILLNSVITYPYSYKAVSLIENDILTKASEDSQAKPSLCAISMNHTAQEDASDTDCIAEILQSQSATRDPFHILIENVNPLMRKLNKTKKKHLLYELLPHVNSLKDANVLTNVAIEDIENRSMSLLLCDIIEHDDSLSIELMLGDEENTLCKEIIKYVGKTLQEITLEDVLCEFRNNMRMAISLRDMCSFSQSLYESLSARLTSVEAAMTDLFNTLQSKQVNTAMKILHIPRDQGYALYPCIRGVADRFFDFNMLKRILELRLLVKNNENQVKKTILAIVGGWHAELVLNMFIQSGIFKEISSVGSEDSLGKRLTNEEFDRFLNITLCDYFLDKRKNEEEKARLARGLFDLFYDNMLQYARALLFIIKSNQVIGKMN